MKKRFVVVGLGTFGASLVEALHEEGCEVIAIDRQMANVEAVKDRATVAVQLDATDASALRALECGSATAAVVAMGEDFESSVLSVAALVEAGVKAIVARARTERQARILKAVGASQVVEIENEMGRRIGHSLATGGEPRR
ncbi:MAG: TrkA family potassium uptake protein [Deltaproteobacteria bacterium]|nr:TrkA family potassium uptake protein [Deltaproteobacteria bacterium]